MDGSECSPAAIYQQALKPAGWDTTQGTSLATPLLAALVADAAQAAGHRLGLLGPALYSLHGPADGLLDVTQGNDSIPGCARMARPAGLRPAHRDRDGRRRPAVRHRAGQGRLVTRPPRGRCSSVTSATCPQPWCSR